MKNIVTGIKVAAISLMLLPLASSAQKNVNYKVVKVQGEIQRVKTGNLLSVGEDVVSNENFSFRTDYSRAVVVNKESGCVVLSARNDNSGPQFLPTSNSMSVRASVPVMPSEVIEYYYGDIFVSGHDSLKIDTEKLEIGDNSYFVVSYNANGKKVSERMELKNGKLVLPQSLVSDKPAKVILTYNDEFGESNKTEFTPIYAGDELKEEIKLIFSTIKGKRDAKITASSSFVNEFYGKTTEDAVDTWIKENLNY
ncbi:MAG: hypothetical protein IKZ99_04950 [Salinivirgaceae bacterium]|nr:hypothetical protein [Salinivirgaceae bacterium]